MRNEFVLLSMLLCFGTPAMAQVSIGIGLPSVSIGINLPLYPDLVPVPGYPVYYAPQLDTNYFFYDGMYWVYQDDSWYASSWYNGPWDMVEPEFIPVFMLRIPVRYYRHAPEYFRGWQRDAPPRWDEHWGRDWAQHRNGWNRWDRNAVPARPPLPTYQRQFTGDRYPHGEQQQILQNQHYRYQPRDPLVRQQREAPPRQNTPVPAQRGPQGMPQERNTVGQHANQPPAAPPPVIHQNAPTTNRPQPSQREEQPSQQPSRQPRQGETLRQQPVPESNRQESGPRDNGVIQEPQREQRASPKYRDNADERDQGRRY